MDAADLRAHLKPQLGVEIGERLVHQHERRLDHDRARNRDALLLAAGQLAGQLVRLPWRVARALSASFDLAIDLGLAAVPRIFKPKPTLCRTLICGKSA